MTPPVRQPIVGEESWSSLCLALSGRPSPDGLYRRLIDAYSEPGRAYHNLDHIAHCLREFAKVRPHIEHPHDLGVALWFHDAIYDPRGHDNEGKSAAWASQALAELGLSVQCIERVHQLILDTRHTDRPRTSDGRFMVDIDLSILGQPEPDYWNYEEAIRLEYSWVAEDRFREGRIAVLNGFLARPRLFATREFFDRYEDLARINLQKAIEKLRDVKSPT